MMMKTTLAKEQPAHRSSNDICIVVMKRLVGHLLVAVCVLGWFTLEWWDGQPSQPFLNDSSATMSTVGGIVDPAAAAMYSVNLDGPNQEGLLLADLEVWVPVAEIESANTDQASTFKEGIEKVDDMISSIGRNNRFFSWKWTVIRNDADSTKTSALTHSIPGCPHCGQIDDDDVFVADYKEGNNKGKQDSMKWKVYRLTLNGEEDFMPNRGLRGFNPRSQLGQQYRLPTPAPSNTKLQNRLCTTFSNMVAEKKENSEGVVDVPIPEENATTSTTATTADNDVAVLQFRSVPARMWTAVYGDSKRPWKGPEKYPKLANSKCRLKWVYPQRPRSVDTAVDESAMAGSGSD